MHKQNTLTKVDFGALGSSISRACTLEHEAQQQLCAEKDEETVQAKPI